jgi:hemoglobin-like flavoprotein
MDPATRQALLERGLDRAAERLGDVTGPVMAEFYQRFPEAQAAFDRLSLGNPAKLEGEMVAQALYCLMTWFEYPGEVKGVLMSSVPHHKQTLEVRPEWYEGLLASSCAVLGACAAEDTHQVWRDVESELRDFIRDAAC